MRLLPLATALIGMTIATAASAGWFAKTTDDIFSGGKSALLAGEIDPYHSLIFDCDSEHLTMALIEKSKEKDDSATGNFRMLVKVDQEAVHDVQGVLSQRNENYTQIATTDQDTILSVLKEIRVAKSKIQVGVQLNESDYKWSGAASSVGSTKEADTFMSACKLK